MIRSFAASGVGGAADGGPPAADGLHGELGGVAVAAHGHPARVGAQVVDAVGHGLALLAGEVVNFDPARVPGRTPGPALAGVLADQFLLLRIDADHRLARGEGSGDPVVDVAELGVAIRVLLALDGLGVGLQAVLQRAGQQPPDAVVGDPVPLASQFPGQVAGRLGGPPQPGHRIAPGLRLDQRVQRIQQRWIGLRERHPPPAGRRARPGIGSAPASSSSTPAVTVTRDTPAARATSETPP